MEKISLRKLFTEALFKVPDYQRGYAWERKQWDDFIEDVDALACDEAKSHYTGTVVTFRNSGAEPLPYGHQRLIASDIVDGQQRLTTTCLYLSLIIRQLIARGERAYEREITEFLYAGSHCKLTLGNSTDDLFYSLLKTGEADVPPGSSHAQRLVGACNHFRAHLERQTKQRRDHATDYLKNLFDAITRKLAFTSYTLEEECEIGMTFELMNSRGKDLSILELLKNYLMHWVARNAPGDERASLTELINRTWRTVYSNVGRANGDEDQCLRIAWTLLCNYTPKNWAGYAGFKEDDYLPLRKFTDRVVIQNFLVCFTEELAGISKLYADIISPTTATELFAEETVWLTKLGRAGNIANFLPLLVAARKKAEIRAISAEDYGDLLRSVECYSYRVFLYNGRRSNAGKSSFYRWGSELFHGEQTCATITQSVHGLTRYYSPEKDFKNDNAAPDDWYSVRHLLRYTLFEFELHLLKREGKNKQPRLRWEDLSETTIEHILPQNPEKLSSWRKNWSDDDRKACTHDIGNLVLTSDNSSYRNFEFVKKCGAVGKSPSYVNSDIRQERGVASFSEWRRLEFDTRREELIDWINNRWATNGSGNDDGASVNEEDDMEGAAN